MVPRTASAALVLVLALAGCGGDDDDDAGAPAPTTTTAAAPTTTAAPTPTSTPRATPTPTARPSRVPPVTARASSIPPGSGVTVILEPDGLGFSSGGASIRQVPFGTGASTITTALSASLGTGKTTQQSTCGQGPRSQVEYNGFSILLDGSQFVGWTENGSAERDLSTADDIKLQVTLAEVKQAYPTAKVTNDSLGPEFFVEDGISGLLDGTSPKSRVTLLYAGETCFSR